MKVKVKDIAEAAGVSPTAVSMVLNGKPCRIAEATKERILRTARELKFHNGDPIFKNEMETRTIGLIIPSDENSFYRRVAASVREVLYTAGYVVLQCTVDEDLRKCYRALEILTSKNVDGMIVIPPCIQSKEDQLIKMLKALQNSGVPMILVDRAVYSVFCDFVVADNKQGGRIATEYLLTKGHKKIGYLSGPRDVYTVRKRMEGYRQALAGAQLACEEKYIYYGDFDAETGRLGAEKLWNAGVTAIFAGNDRIAEGIYQFATEKNLNIPEDLSVVGFDNGELCDYMKPALTSVEQSAEQIGERAAEVILHNIDFSEEEQEPPRNFYFSPVLIERASVREIIDHEIA